MPKKLRICLIGNQAFSLVNFRGPLIADMVAAGHRVMALAPDYDESTRSAVRALGAEPVSFSLSRTGMNPLSDLLDMLRLAFLLRRLKPDLTLGYAIKPVIYGTIAAWLAGVPRRFAMIEGLGYVFTPPEGREPLKRRVLRHVVEQLYRAALSRAARVIFLNRDDVQEFLSRGLVSSDKAFLLGGIGVDLDEWKPAPPVKHPVTFLLAARLLREKGIVEYAEAARLVRSRYPDTRFILLGGLDTNPGGLRRDEIEAWVSEGILEWPGHVPDVRPWLAQASVFVLPSYYREGVPRSTQEAMAMARPVITTDAPGCRETVFEGKNGFLVPPRDVGALAEAMERFVLEPELIGRMGEASRRIAEERFDVRIINKRMMEAMGLG
ncbi:MAG: glycosyltransferase family 4 protein [Methanothrix sp.]|jgi:glycosyltransferase involved in cell wall biosynthesis|uniref:glycosyltransferase family 4 protein n=1 Tax=Methanothrix sp. TaxID=90426 RepID=UPI00247CA99C|nr:glycosyltransferase family 4 protein [Methanothrix sp.]